VDDLCIMDVVSRRFHQPVIVEILFCSIIVIIVIIIYLFC
jgi:hypothetical protein